MRFPIRNRMRCVNHCATWTGSRSANANRTQSESRCANVIRSGSENGNESVWRLAIQSRNAIGWAIDCPNGNETESDCPIRSESQRHCANERSARRVGRRSAEICWWLEIRIGEEPPIAIWIDDAVLDCGCPNRIERTHVIYWWRARRSVPNGA